MKLKVLIFFVFLLFFLLVFSFTKENRVNKSCYLQNKKDENRKHKKDIYNIPRTNKKIKIDGLLDEEAWKKALKFDLDIEVMPSENIPAPVKTKCYLVFDKDKFYIGFKAFDPNPKKIRAFLSDRDEMFRDDFVGVILDTFNDENRAFVFFVNPLGVQGDEIMSNGGTKEDASWDAIWDSAGEITDFGYIVEMAIPFSSMQFQPSEKEQVWGFLPLRTYPRSRRHQISFVELDRGNPCTLCQMKKIKGFKDATPGKNIELDPTITGIRMDDRDNFPEGEMEEVDSNVNLGITGTWGFTNNLTLSTALNPDFSQVEADAAQLDINKQFALYYPEKRPFFLEGMDFFETRKQALYTRSIADPDWGIKVSGKEGKNAVGIFSAQDATTNLLFPGAESSSFGFMSKKSYATVVRYRRDVGNSSTLGVLVTDREADDYYNRVGGVDGLLRFSDSDSVSFQFLGSSTKYPANIANKYSQGHDELSGYIMSLGVSRDKKNYFLFAEYDDVSSSFRADLGFIPQVNYRQFEVGGGYIYWGKKDDFLTRIIVSGNYDQTNKHNGDLLEREVEAYINFEGPMQSYGEWGVGKRKKVYLGKAFDQWFNHIFFRIIPAGNFEPNIYISFGDEIDLAQVRGGKYLTVSPEFRLNYGKHINLKMEYMYHRLNIESERLFLVNILQGKFIYHFNNRAFFRAILQYRDVKRNTELYEGEIDPKEKSLFSQLLFSYKINPRTVLFLGYSDNYFGFQNLNLTQKDRTFFFKIGYAFNI